MANYRFTINGVVYTIGDFDFNTMADLADIGISAAQLLHATPNVLRAYLAVASGMTLQQAGDEITKHIIADGDFDEMVEAVKHSLENSDFFRKITEIPAEEAPENPEEEKPKETKEVTKQ